MTEGASAAVYSSFAQIAKAARELNTQLAVPEVVFIGFQSHGKSTLIEALLGHKFLPVGEETGGVTKRFVHVNLINNPACEVPRVTIKRDTVDSPLKKFEADTVVSIETTEQAVAELSKGGVSNTPIYVDYEFKDTWNMTLIDTTGLIGKGKGQTPPRNVDADDVEEHVIQKTASVAHRLLVFVEDVKSDGDGKSEMLAFAKRVDPKLERSILVVNKFNEQLKNFTAARDLNKYLAGVAPPDARVFFASLLEPQERSKDAGGFASRSAVLATLQKKTQDDLETLEALQFDRRWTDSVGVQAVRTFILDWTWRRHQDAVPEVLKRLRSFKRRAEQSLQATEAQMDKLQPQHLRSTSARYVVQFLQTTEKLLSGSLEGQPALNGQDLTEEKEACSDAGGSWYSHMHSLVDFDENSVPQREVKLYGGQQFERLLAEFKRVAEQIDMEPITSADVATATGAGKVTNAAAVTWAASDLVQKQLTRHLRPLVAQLFIRATYIMSRVGDIASRLLAESASNTGISIGEFPYFTHAVRELFDNFVQEAAVSCTSKCLDEFMTTRLIQWEAKKLGGSALDPKRLAKEKDAEKVVEELAASLYASIRDRLVTNITLKTYNYFFVPMQTDLWGEIQGRITCVSDDELEEMFEVDSALNRLKDDKVLYETVVSKFTGTEAELMKHSAIFSARV